MFGDDDTFLNTMMCQQARPFDELITSVQGDFNFLQDPADLEPDCKSFPRNHSFPFHLSSRKVTLQILKEIWKYIFQIFPQPNLI